MHMRAVEHTINRGSCTHHAAWVNHTENRCQSVFQTRSPSAVIVSYLTVARANTSELAETQDQRILPKQAVFETAVNSGESRGMPNIRSGGFGYQIKIFAFSLRNVCENLNPLERLAYYLLGWVNTWPSMVAHAAKGKWKTTSGGAVVSCDREELCRG